MKYVVLLSEEEVREAIKALNHLSCVVLDLETAGLDSFNDSIVDIQIGDDEVVYIFSEQFAFLLPSISTRVVGHNLRFDIMFLYRKGVDVTRWEYHDTLLLGHLLDENRESYKLDSYVKEYWNDNYKEEFWKKYKTYQDASPEDAYGYGARDVCYTGKLYTRFIQDLRDQGIPDALVSHVHRLQYSLLKTEIRGICVDESYILRLGVDLKTRIDSLLPQMREMIKIEADLVELNLWQKQLDKRKTEKGKSSVQRPEFSFDSSNQLQAVLYNHLGIPPQRNEKTKALSVDDASLEKLRNSHPVIPLIQEYRSLNKVYTAYIEGTLERMKNGRIYPEFRVNGTKTGRISHSNPNLGQLPKAGGIRGIYIPEPNCVFISADYSQLEVCIEANLTADPNLKRIFEEGLSKHDITASELSVDRDTAKTLNFALQFWCTHMKVAKLLGVSEKEGYEVWKRYWEIYKGPKELKSRTDRAVDSGETLQTAFGRKRRFEVRKRSPFDGDYRQAYNFLIQGTGADLTSRSFYLVSEWLEEKKIGRGLLTVHDELIIEVKEEYWQEAEQQMLETMVNVGHEIGLKIPLAAQSSGKMVRWED